MLSKTDTIELMVFVKDYAHAIMAEPNQIELKECDLLNYVHELIEEKLNGQRSDIVNLIRDF